MRIIYDANTDMLTVVLSERPAADNFGTADNYVEVDGDGAPVTIVMSSASSRVDLQNVSIEGIDFGRASLQG